MTHENAVILLVASLAGVISPRGLCIAMVLVALMELL